MTYSEKQLQIIDTAEQLFAIHGYDGTSVREIADKAGVNLAMISYYFGSKEKLMQSLVDIRTCHIKLTLETLLRDEELSPIQKLSLFTQEIVERFVQKQLFFRIMISEQMLHKNNEIMQMLKEVKKRNIEILTRLIAYGQKKKVFKKNADVVLMMNTLVGTITQTLINKDFYREQHQLENLEEQEFNSLLIKRLSEQIMIIFKAILTYEV